MNARTQLALPTTLTDLLLAREKALNLMSNARRTLAMAGELLAPFGSNLMPFAGQMRDSEEAARRELDRRMWSRALDLTGFTQLMDTQEVKVLDKSLEGAPPEFTEGNIRATLIDLQIRADEMFRRGVFNVFRSLSDDYRANESEPFRIGPKVVMGGMVRPSFTRGLCINDSHSNYAANKLNDIDRVIQTLDKQLFHSRSLETAMNGVFLDRGVFEDDYYRAKAFKNGNLHLEFKRHDLLDKLNEQIADYYHYNALADGRNA